MSDTTKVISMSAEDTAASKPWTHERALQGTGWTSVVKDGDGTVVYVGPATIADLVMCSANERKALLKAGAEYARKVGDLTVENATLRAEVERLKVVLHDVGHIVDDEDGLPTRELCWCPDDPGCLDLSDDGDGEHFNICLAARAALKGGAR